MIAYPQARTSVASCFAKTQLAIACLLAFTLLVATSNSAVAAEKIELKQTDEGVDVLVDGELFTTYVKKSGAKPILWPIVGPQGVQITRSYPMREGVEGEKSDHPHHRSLWFTHGDVNGVSYWHETEGHGDIVHQDFQVLESGETATIKSANDWIDPSGNKVCEDVRTFQFGARGEYRWIDVDIVVTASADEVVFGDTKEGSFGVRIAGTMKEDSKLGGKIMTSEGLTGGASWGKPAKWVDYHGPVDGHTVGIAIMNHPTSYGFPSHWHVRTYGLFAANPFGMKDFYGKDAGKDGTLKLAKGESFTLRYRVLIHPGDEKEGMVEAFYEDYIATVKE